jgi:hypothetical protein
MTQKQPASFGGIYYATIKNGIAQQILREGVSNAQNNTLLNMKQDSYITHIPQNHTYSYLAAKRCEHEAGLT